MTQPAQDTLIAAAQAGEPLADCLVIDAHAHLGPYSAFPYVDSTAEGLIGALDRLGINRAWVSSVWGCFQEDRLGNDYILEALRKFPDRLGGYMTLRSAYPQGAVAEMERCYAGGMRAVKIYDLAPELPLPYDHPHYDDIYAFANAHALPVLAHTWGQKQIEAMRPGIEKYDRIKWLLGHSGAADVEHYVEFANEYPHVYLETCFSLAPRGMMERLVAEAPLHKILWGSDQVFMSGAHQLGKVIFARLTPEQKRALLGENAAQVFTA